MKRTIPVAMILTAALLTGCGGAREDDTDVQLSITAMPLGWNDSLQTTQASKATQAPAANGSSQKVYCGYERLTSNEKKIYDEICLLIEQGKTEFELSYDEDDIGKVYYEVVGDHPEYFWLGTGYSYTARETNGVKNVSFRPAASDSADIAQRKLEMDSAVNAILTEANKKSSAYEKIMYIHDYLVDNTDYDKQTAAVMDASSASDKLYDATTAYGGLVKHNAVCSGYSAAFQLLAQKLGVPCGRTNGAKIGGGSHEWNYVILDGDYYYIDVTWDDPQSDGDAYETDNRTYDFFCITSDELQKTHIINSDRFIPNCTATEYDYYIYNGLYIDTYDRSRAEDIIRKETGAAAMMKFSSAAERQRAVTDLIDNGVFSEITGMSSYRYSMGDAGLSLTIYLN